MTFRLRTATAPQWRDLAATAPVYLRLGWCEAAAAASGTTFVPAVVDADGATALLPLFLAGDGTGQSGRYAYGGPWPVGSLPVAPVLAEACVLLGTASCGTLLDPRAVAGADEPAWTSETFVADLARGEDAVWSGLHASVRTAVRRARERRTTRPVDAGHAAEIAALYERTLARSGAAPALPAAFVEHLLGDATTVAVGAFDGDEVVAASVVAADADRAYHVLQVAADRDNSGHLALWEAVATCVGRGVGSIDLGGAKSDGQAWFKRRWGGRSVRVAGFRGSHA